METPLEEHCKTRNRCVARLIRLQAKSNYFSQKIVRSSADSTILEFNITLDITQTPYDNHRSFLSGLNVMNSHLGRGYDCWRVLTKLCCVQVALSRSLKRRLDIYLHMSPGGRQWECSGKGDKANRAAGEPNWTIAIEFEGG